MNRLRHHPDRLGCGGTSVFAGTAADTIIVGDLREQYKALFNGKDGVGGAGFAAGTTMFLSHMDDTYPSVKNDGSDSGLPFLAQ